MEQQEEHRERLAEILQSQLRELEAKLDKATLAVERALFEGLISESERSEYGGRIESVRKAVSDIQTSQQGTLHGLSAALDEIDRELHGKRQVRLKDLKRRWERIRTQIRERQWPEDKAMELEQRVQRAVEDADVRLLNEMLEAAGGAIREQRLPDELWEVQPREEDFLSDFSQKAPAIYDYLYRMYKEGEKGGRHPLRRTGDILKNRRPLPWFTVDSLPRERYETSAEVVYAWHELKHPRRRDITRQLEMVMQFLGFTPTGASPVSVKDTQERYFQGWSVQAEPSDRVPVPEFGSSRRGRYSVVGVWERPGLDIISTFLQERGEYQPQIVLYFGLFSERQRQDLLHYLRRAKLPALVIDEVLLLYLTEAYGSRLAPLFQCTLPYAVVHPYSRSGYVPPEMFFGRNDILTDLMRPGGTTFIYGGRQLGKTALLKRAQERFHRPEERRYAIFLDIKDIGDPEMRYGSRSGTNYAQQFWRAIGRELYSMGLIHRRTADSTNPQRITDAIEKLTEEQGYQILLLLDEADKFLEADARNDFPVLNQLKTLLFRTEQRFKPVFAGLHSVQRFSRIRNHPLAQFGRAQVVGPLPPEAAIDLLEQPLKVMGYRFESRDEILRVLSYTNYHPGLIQLFGEELTEHMNRKVLRQPGKPPFRITREDIEEVYAKTEVRNEVRNRFIWTLNLDKRYHVIALAMVYDQWDSRNGFDRQYSVRELFELASNHWPTGFQGLKGDAFRSYLAEMVGLGILTATDGRYRLRSPNLVALLGTYDEIENELLEVLDSPAPQEALESHHARLPNRRYSPLSVQQESLITDGKGVVLVMGNAALGYRTVPSALKYLIGDDPQSLWKDLSGARPTVSSLQKTLNTVLRNRSARERYVYQDLSTLTDSQQLANYVRAAVEICDRRREQHLRVIFAMNQRAMLPWFQLPESERHLAETIVLQKWDLESIRHRLEQEEMLSSPPICGLVLQVTGGWTWLLDTLFQRTKGDDPKPALNELQKELDQGELGDQFISNLAIPTGLSTEVLRITLEVASGLQDGATKEEEEEELVHFLSSELLASEEAGEAKIRQAITLLEYMGVLDIRLRHGRRWVRVDPIVARVWPRWAQ